MGIFDRLKEPVFLKESSDASRQLEGLRELESSLTPAGREKLKQDIKNLEYGIQGENQIAFELKNSHTAMYILHDIYLEDGGLSAQIDYLVVTRKLCFIIECKNLYGNIEITSNGEFIRTVEYGGRSKKEGIYSPVTQNVRHMELLKKIKAESRGNRFTQNMTAKFFEDFHKSIVVLANPRTVLNCRYAKKEIKDKVIRADQLVAYIKEQNRLSKELEQSDAQMEKWANSFLKLHKEVEKDYTAKYQQYLLVEEEDTETAPVQENGAPVSESEDAVGIKAVVGEQKDCAEKMHNETAEQLISKPLEDTELFKKLKAYRLEKSREEKIKPYYIYNDYQLRDLISKMPETKEELKKVSGFGPVKAEKYGEDVLTILSEYREM